MDDDRILYIEKSDIRSAGEGSVPGLLQKSMREDKFQDEEGGEMFCDLIKIEYVCVLEKQSFAWNRKR